LGHFSYKAVSNSGEHVTGQIEAADHKSAVTMLADKGHFVTQLHEQSLGPGDAEGSGIGFDINRLVKLGGRRVTSKDILAMTTQLGTALRAGLPLLNGLKLIHDQQHKAGMREMLAEMVEAVSSGQSLSDAMSKYPRTFSPLYLSMIRVGETGGILEETTSQLASILGRDEKIKTSMKNASAYPIFVLTIGIISVAIIVTMILPNILSVTGGGATSPLPTRILMWTSNFLRGVFTTVQGWLFIAALIAGLVYFVRWTRTSGRLQWDTFKLKIPILGPVLRTIAVGRLARTLGALTEGGVTILEALAVVRDTLGNELLGKEIDSVAEKVKRGESLADPLGESGLFPPLLVQITAIGEQTGKLDELLLNAADTFDTEADSAINRFMSVFPALLILALAVVIGFIIVATLMPILMMSFGAGGM
jgi:type II secretory pathway component PulF